MKIFLVFVLLAFSISASPSQTAQPKSVDWSKLNPDVIEIAMDGVDAIERMAEAVNDPSIPYGEREDEAEKIFQKLRRTVESDADKRVLGDAASYHFQVSSCHIIYVDGNCSASSLSGAHDRAIDAIKQDKKKFLAAKGNK